MDEEPCGPFILAISLLLLDFVSLGAFLAIYHIKGYLVAFINCDIRLQTSCVYEIVLSIVASYKSKVLDSVKKLHCSVYHL